MVAIGIIFLFLISPANMKGSKLKNMKTLNSPYAVLSLFCIMCSACSSHDHAMAENSYQDTSVAAAPAVAASAAAPKDSAVPVSGPAMPMIDSTVIPTTAVRTFTKVDDRTYKVEVMIRHNNASGPFKKLLEKIPEGYTVTGDSVDEDVTVTKNPGELKFLWMHNERSDFSVGYTLSIPKHKKLIRDYEGSFAWIEQDHKAIVSVSCSN